MTMTVRRRGLAQLSVPETQNTVLERIGAGETLSKIAVDLEISNLALQMWIDDPVRAAAVTAARKAGAAALVDQTIQIADCALPVITPDGEVLAPDPARDKLRIGTRQWMAERRDRQTWSTVKDGVTINIAGLHLDALRIRPAAQAVDVSYIEGSYHESELLG